MRNLLLNELNLINKIVKLDDKNIEISVISQEGNSYIIMLGINANKYLLNVVVDNNEIVEMNVLGYMGIYNDNVKLYKLIKNVVEDVFIKGLMFETLKNYSFIL